MDLLLHNGDLLLGADGEPLTVTGLGRADQQRIRAAVEEALCPLAGVTVLGIRLRPEADQLEVQVELEADGLRESTGLLLSL